MIGYVGGSLLNPSHNSACGAGRCKIISSSLSGVLTTAHWPHLDAHAAKACVVIHMYIHNQQAQADHDRMWSCLLPFWPWKLAGVPAQVDELTPEDIELATMSSRDEDDSSPDAAWGPDDMRDSFTNRSSSVLSHLDSGLSITSPAEELAAVSAKRLSSARRSSLHRPGGVQLPHAVARYCMRAIPHPDLSGLGHCQCLVSFADRSSLQIMLPLDQTMQPVSAVYTRLMLLVCIQSVAKFFNTGPWLLAVCCKDYSQEKLYKQGQYLPVGRHLHVIVLAACCANSDALPWLVQLCSACVEALTACWAAGDDLLFDLEEGPEDADAPAATLTSFTGSMSKPLSLSYSSSPEQPHSPINTPQRKQLGMPNQGDSLFQMGVIPGQPGFCKDHVQLNPGPCARKQRSTWRQVAWSGASEPPAAGAQPQAWCKTPLTWSQAKAGGTVRKLFNLPHACHFH